VYSPRVATSTGYLRIGELARRTGMSPEVLRAWEQRYGLLRPERSAGGFRLYSDLDERRVRRVKELIAAGLSASEAARRALEPSEAADAVTPLIDELSEAFGDALDRFDGQGAHEAFDALLAAFSVETVLDVVVLAYLRTLGDRWSRGDASVAQEHFASNLIRGRLLGLARGWDAGTGPGLVLACPPGERHDLPLIVFGVVAARRGWRVTFLGGDTPFDTVRDAARSADPALIVLSVSTASALEDNAEEIRRLADAVPVAVGGNADPERVAELGARPLEGDPVAAARALVLDG
jgi:MerR family transcriptional regulator, light-induced transcriptional regulator